MQPRRLLFQNSSNQCSWRARSWTKSRSQRPKLWLNKSKRTSVSMTWNLTPQSRKVGIGMSKRTCPMISLQTSSAWWKKKQWQKEKRKIKKCKSSSSMLVTMTVKMDFLKSLEGLKTQRKKRFKSRLSQLKKKILRRRRTMSISATLWKTSWQHTESRRRWTWCRSKRLTKILKTSSPTSRCSSNRDIKFHSKTSKSSNRLSPRMWYKRPKTVSFPKSWPS